MIKPVASRAFSKLHYHIWPDFAPIAKLAQPYKQFLPCMFFSAKIWAKTFHKYESHAANIWPE